jgi:hypothetical protein
LGREIERPRQESIGADNLARSIDTPSEFEAGRCGGRACLDGGEGLLSGAPQPGAAGFERGGGMAGKLFKRGAMCNFVRLFPKSQASGLEMKVKLVIYSTMVLRLTLVVSAFCFALIAEDVPDERRYFASARGYDLLLSPDALTVKLSDGEAVSMRIPKSRLTLSRSTPRLNGQGLNGQGLNGQGLNGQGLNGQGLNGQGENAEYKAVYPGIDLVVYRQAATFEYDWLVHPNSDPSAIRFSFEGANAEPALDDGRNLVLQTRKGQWWHRKPMAYQISGGKRQSVTAYFVLLDNHEAGIEGFLAVWCG